MSGRDELDKSQLGQFAWKLIKSGEKVDLSRLAEPFSMSHAEPRFGPREHAQPFARSSSEEAIHEAAALARRIDQVWTMREPYMQALATDGLALHTAALGLPGMHDHHPRESVRLARLFVRHHSRLSPPAWEAAVGACFWLEYSHPETVTLMEELAHSGLRVLAMPLLVQLEPGEEARDPSRMFPDAPARLARVLDETNDDRARIIALEFLAMVGCKGVTASLRRALRVPQIEVRHLAIETLLSHAPTALTDEDVLFLLNDLVAHPYPKAAGQNADTMLRYAWFLHRAVARVRPAGGEGPLFDIASGIIDDDNEDSQDDSQIDAHWAIRALAAGYPDLALPLVDAQLADARVQQRKNGVEAASELPRHYAETRLLHAAGDGASDIADLARNLYLKIMNVPCPVGEMTGVPLQLLVAPPSERFRQRLAVLRGRLPGPKATTVALLLGEARDPERASEALALLVFALADDEIWDQTTRGGGKTHLPRTRRAWCKRLYQCFGASSLAALAWLADRYPTGERGGELDDEQMGYLAAIALLVEEGLFRKSDVTLLASIAARRLELDAEDESALAILAKTGVPSSLLERLWRVALADCDLWTGSKVVRALQHNAQLYAVDARAALEMQVAWTGRDFARMHRAAVVGVRRNAKLSCALALRFLDEEAENGAAFEALSTCAKGLGSAGRLPANYLLAALAKPESQLFSVAARTLPRSLSSAARAALEAALSSTARHSMAAVEAANCLLSSDEKFNSRDRRYTALLARAPHPERAALIGRSYMRGASFSLVSAHLPELLASPDPEVAANLNWMVLLDTRGQRTQLRKWLPAIANQSLRNRIARQLGKVQRDDYWLPEIPEE